MSETSDELQSKQKVRLFRFSSGEIIAAYSEEMAACYYEETIGPDADVPVEIPAHEMRMKHRLMRLDTGRDWLNIPAGSLEMYVDALGRDLIEGKTVPFLFSTQNYL